MHKLIILMTIEQKEIPKYTRCCDCGGKIRNIPLRDRCGECSGKYWDQYVKSAKTLQKEAEKTGLPFSMGGTFDG